MDRQMDGGTDEQGKNNKSPNPKGWRHNCLKVSPIGKLTLNLC